MDTSYAEKGTEVILGKHVNRSCGTNWSDTMDLYVGCKTKIVRVTGKDYSGCLCCVVECDRSHFWRVENMILASDVPLLTPEQKVQLRIQDG